jgi:hypothetical protein
MTSEAWQSSDQRAAISKQRESKILHHLTALHISWAFADLETLHTDHFIRLSENN